MNLGNWELIPGVIINANDPLNMGRVQVGAPNEMDTSSMDKDLLPWVEPFCSSGHQRYSKPLEKQKVWLLKDTTNIDNYWYLPANDLTGDAQNIVNEKNDSNVEIMHLRQVGGGLMQQTVDDKEGYVTKTETSSVTIAPTGKANIVGGDSEVSLNNGEILIKGGENELQRMLLGDNVCKLFSDMANIYSEMAKVCLEKWGLSPLAPYYLNLANTIQSAISGLQSSNVKNN